jgi:amidase
MRIVVGNAMPTMSCAAVMFRTSGCDHDSLRGYGEGWNVMARYLRGIYDDVATMPHPDRLEQRTRSMARAGSRISDRRIATVRAREVALTNRVNAIFDDADVVLTPGTATGPPRVGAFTKHGAFITVNATMGRSPFQAIFNATGQPAAVVPWGLDRIGLPTSIQLVGRPSDEATLLALGAQIEEAHPSPDRRPLVSKRNAQLPR